MKQWTCSHAAAGCNYPESECNGTCVESAPVSNIENEEAQPAESALLAAKEAGL